MEIRISYVADYRMRRGERMVIINLTSVPEFAGKYGLIGEEKLYTAAEIKKAVSKILLKESQILYLFAQDKSGKQGKVGINVWKSCPVDMGEDKIIQKQGYITIQV